MTKTTRTTRTHKTNNSTERNEFANKFFRELDDKITSGKITTSTGGVKIIWSKQLRSTAGCANWHEDGCATIQLAHKIITNYHRLKKVLAHEFCHLVDLIILGGKGKPHGEGFKVYAARAMRVFGERGVQVTTTLPD